VKASEVISKGGVIAFRTDTFYGLGADPFNSHAVARVRELKGREDDKPILLLISDHDYVARLLINLPEAFKQVAEKFWPGPLTIIGSAVASLPQQVTAGTGTVGIRLPADEQVRELVRECGGVLTATSANPSGRQPARTAREVAEYFSTGLDLIVDGGDVTATKPSTVLDVLTSPPRVIREGAIGRNVIEQIFT
jgi:L-threonylcarbamoyladenylate synthase